MNVSAYHRRQYRERAAWPDTVMSRAFLIALTKWAIAHHDDLTTTITLPIGRVTSEQLVQVLGALERARRGDYATTPTFYSTKKQRN